MSKRDEGAGTRPEAADGAELAITDNAEERRYEARLGDVVAGWVDYGRVQSRLVALHTEVLPRFGGRGIATAPRAVTASLARQWV